MSIEVNAGIVTIKYATTHGLAYHLESSATMASGSWTPVPGSSVTASGSEETFSFPVPDDEKQFFRTVSP